MEVYLDSIISPEWCSQRLVRYLHVKFCYMQVAVSETSLFVAADSVLSGSVYSTQSIALY